MHGGEAWTHFQNVSDPSAGRPPDRAGPHVQGDPSFLYRDGSRPRRSPLRHLGGLIEHGVSFQCNPKPGLVDLQSVPHHSGPRPDTPIVEGPKTQDPPHIEDSECSFQNIAQPAAQRDPRCEIEENSAARALGAQEGESSTPQRAQALSPAPSPVRSFVLESTAQSLSMPVHSLWTSGTTARPPRVSSRPDLSNHSTSSENGAGTSRTGSGEPPPPDAPSTTTLQAPPVRTHWGESSMDTSSHPRGSRCSASKR